MLRSAAAILVSFMLMALVILVASIAIWFAAGLDRVLRPGTYEGTPLLYVASIAIGLLGAGLGGWLCAALSRSVRAVAVFGGLCLVMGLGNAAAQHNKPEPGSRPADIEVTRAITVRKEPVWFTLLMPIAGAAVAWSVGKGALASGSRRRTVEREPGSG